MVVWRKYRDGKSHWAATEVRTPKKEIRYIEIETK